MSRILFASAEVLCNRNYHFFLVSWVSLSRTCNPKPRVSLVCLSSCAAMCHGKCWHGTFPLSHCFACTAEVSVTCVSVVYFSSVLVAWQCFHGWSFLHLVLIMWGPLDSRLVVCLWGHCSSLDHREALDAAAVWNCSVQSSVQPWQNGFTTVSRWLLFPLPVMPKAGRVPWGTLKYRGQPQKDQCSSMHHKCYQSSSVECIFLHGGGANPSSFKQSIKDTNLTLSSKVLLWPRSTGHLPQWPSLESFTTQENLKTDIGTLCRFQKPFRNVFMHITWFLFSSMIATWENAHFFFFFFAFLGL